MVILEELQIHLEILCSGKSFCRRFYDTTIRCALCKAALNGQFSRSKATVKRKSSNIMFPFWQKSPKDTFFVFILINCIWHLNMFDARYGNKSETFSVSKQQKYMKFENYCTVDISVRSHQNGDI